MHPVGGRIALVRSQPSAPGGLWTSVRQRFSGSRSWRIKPWFPQAQAQAESEPPVDTDLREAARRYLTTPPAEELVEAMQPLVTEMLSGLADLLGNVQAQLGDKARAQARLVLADIAARSGG